MPTPRSRLRRLGLVIVLFATVLVPLRASAGAAATLPTGFQEQIVFSGLNHPTNVEFAPNGQIFVAEQDGRVKVFDNPSDPTATLFADLSTNVNSYWDRGLIGLAVPPDFPANPWIYVLYTYDAPPGHTAPFWHDACAEPATPGCPVTGRLSRLRAAGSVMTGAEQVLVSDWCQQTPSHSMGDLTFAPDGTLYASAGEGASFSTVDRGQFNDPCDNPPNEGGALRAQDLTTPSDPTGLSGSVIKLTPATLDALAADPGSATAADKASWIVGYGLRNPFRITTRPGSSEVWAADVGWSGWEEINRIVPGAARNLGWPCYEGAAAQPAYNAANVPLCEGLYAGSQQVAPYFTYHHTAKVVPGEACGTGSSAASGLVFYPTTGGSYPAGYAGALFFADHSRSCIWAMKPSVPGGLPDPANIETLASNAAWPADLELGLDNQLYYVDVSGGTVRCIRHYAGNQPPVATASATPTAGPAPLTVNLNGTGSFDPDTVDQGALTYEWDFTDDGTIDATGATAAFTYVESGAHKARLRVRDPLGAVGTTTVTINAGNEAPTTVIDTPTPGTTWKVDDSIHFTGHATDAQDGDLPASALTWHVTLQHCYAPGNCHAHHLQDFTGVTSGSFPAPDHEYPSYLEIELVAKDSSGLTNNIVRRLDPKSVEITFASNPPGLQLAVGSEAAATPFTRTFILGSSVTISGLSPQAMGVNMYGFVAWSDGMAQSHVVTADASGTFTASYQQTGINCRDSYGYVCADGDVPFVPATGRVLGLTGDNAVTQVSLPFGVRFYGSSFRTAWVDTNGLITFTRPAGSARDRSAIPSLAKAGRANLAVYPFWDDLVVDADASVRELVTGVAPNRRYVVEWRDVTFAADRTKRVTFEVIFEERGAITFAYAGIDGSPIESGDTATVGLENRLGTVAVQYLYREAKLREGSGVTFVRRLAHCDRSSPLSTC